MKKSIFLFIIVIVIAMSSCKKPLFDNEKKIIGKWQIESVEKEKPLFNTTDISNDLGYQHIDFSDNHTVKLFLKDATQPVEGTWAISYETTYIYSTDDATTPVCQMKLSISWDNPPKYLEKDFVDIVTKQKLNFYSVDDNQWVRFKCTK